MFKLRGSVNIKDEKRKINENWLEKNFGLDSMSMTHSQYEKDEEDRILREEQRQVNQQRGVRNLSEMPQSPETRLTNRQSSSPSRHNFNVPKGYRVIKIEENPEEYAENSKNPSKHNTARKEPAQANMPTPRSKFRLDQMGKNTSVRIENFTSYEIHTAIKSEDQLTSLKKLLGEKSHMTKRISMNQA